MAARGLLTGKQLCQRTGGFGLFRVFVFGWFFSLGAARRVLLGQPARELLTLLFDARQFLLALLERTTGSSCHT
jgi:hypothetical protein